MCSRVWCVVYYDWCVVACGVYCCCLLLFVVVCCVGLLLFVLWLRVGLLLFDECFFGLLKVLRMCWLVVAVLPVCVYFKLCTIWCYVVRSVFVAGLLLLVLCIVLVRYCLFSVLGLACCCLV